MPETPVNLDAYIDTMVESINRDLGMKIVHRTSVAAALGKIAPRLLAEGAAIGRKRAIIEGPCCQDAGDSDGNAHAEDCRYLAGVLFGRKQAAADLRPLIDDLTDPDPCWYDHHGYCQGHGWLETDPRCPHARAKDVLAQGGEPNAG